MFSRKATAAFRAGKIPSGETRLHFLSAMRKENRGVAVIETGGEQQSTGLLHWMVRVSPHTNRNVQTPRKRILDVCVIGTEKIFLGFCG